VSLFARIALTAAALLGVAAALALLLWKPRSERSFAARTDEILKSAERDFGTVATSLVDEAMEFSASSALASDEQKALSVQDLPLALYTDADGRMVPERLREAMRVAVADPDASGARKHATVRAEILDHTRRDVEKRLAALREVQMRAAARHGEEAAWRTMAAWGGMLLLLLAGWAVILDRVVLRPLREATRAMGRFGDGERGLRLSPSGAAELATFGRVFNGTAAAVEQTEAENAELRAGLEEKVRERTSALVRAARASTAGTMAGGIAHEFNNLLSGILGCAEAALGEDPSPEVREALEMVRKTAQRGVGVTRALLRATSATPEVRPCDAAHLLDEALAEVRPGPEVEILRAYKPVRVIADAAMLHQVLGNLIRNAVEAMGGRGRLTLGAGPEGDGAFLSVADSGSGIDPAVRDVLFEPFVSTRRGGREGAGLGLFLADSLVRAHRGRLEVESEVGKGSRFTIHLPGTPFVGAPE